MVIRSNSANTNIGIKGYVDSTDNTKGDKIYLYGTVGQIAGVNSSKVFDKTVGATFAMDSLHVDSDANISYLKVEEGHVENAGTIDLIFATTTDVKVTNTGDIDHAHVCATGTGDTETAVYRAGVLNEQATGVTFDYDKNVAQNSDPDVYHHVDDTSTVVGEKTTKEGVWETPTQVEDAGEEVVKANQFNLPSELTIGDGETQKICDNAEKYAFSSSDESIAYVANGILTANGEGTATLTADGKTCEVTVKLFHYDSEAETPYGDGTSAHPYEIVNRQQMLNINEIETYSYFKWAGASSIDASNWNTDIYLCGSFDGNGVTFNNLDSYLFRAVWNGSDSWHPKEDLVNTYTISNLTVNANIVNTGWTGGVLRVAGVHNFVMDSVTVHGYLEGATGVAPFVCLGAGNYTPESEGYTYDGNITFKNCTSDATIVAKSGKAVGFVAHAMMKSSTGKITLENSSFTGVLSATDTANCKYVVGNWCNATITDDAKSTKDGTIYSSSTNGWQYIAAGKTGSFSVEEGTLPANVGDAFTFAAKTGATKATVALQISPNPYNMTSVYAAEEVTAVDGTFTTSEIKYFTIRINADGVTETGIHGNYFDIVSEDFDGTLGSNTIIRITQYNNAGSIVGIININFHDVR